MIPVMEKYDMNELFDSEKINDYLERYHIREIFETKELDFRLFVYEKGELIVNAEDTLSYFRFLVEGSFWIYAIREDGSYFRIGQGEAPALFGDVEFASGAVSPFYAEAAERVLCVVLSFERYRNVLARDASFLRFVMRSLAQKVEMLSNRETENCNLTERVLLYADRHAGRIEHVEEVARQLHCSRRQLQRILKQLQEENRIVRLGKGKYQCSIWKSR